MSAPKSSTLKTEEVREAVRLGQDVFTQGSLAEETMNRAVEAFGRFSGAMERQAVIDEVKTSGLRGRGGAGFHR